MTVKVKIGAVGLAGHGRAMLDAIDAAGNLELSACYDIDAATSKKVAAEFGCSSSASMETMLADRGLEGVVIVAPNHLHADFVIASARSGKACFVEKPIANTLEDANRMIEACAGKGVLLSVGHNFRRRAELRKAKEWTDGGKLGDIVSCEANLSRPGVRILPEGDWRLDGRKCPMPPLMQLGIHFVDAYLHIFGPVRRVTALASPSSSSPETAVVALLDFSSGATGYIGANYLSREGWFMRVYGTKANLYLTDGSVVLDGMDTAPTSVEPGPVDTLAEELREFGEAVRGRGSIEVDGSAGLEALKVVRAMITSARESCAVDV